MAGKRRSIGGPVGRRVRRRYNFRYRPRAVVSRRMPTFSIVRTFQTNIASTLNQTQYLGYYFALSQVPAYTELTNLFDFYKITGVRITFIPQFNSAEIGTNTVPMIYYTPDKNDAITPSTLTEIMEYPQCKIRRLDRPVSVFFRPSARITGGFESKQWLATSDPSTQYYGLKIGVVGGTACNVLMIWRFYMKFKTPK